MNNGLLYFYPRTDNSRWSHEPPGKFSVERFINSEAYWQQTGREEECRKRTLVLCNWGLSGYNRSELERCIDVFLGLLQDGFVLYAWQKGQVVQLDQQNLRNFLLDPVFTSKLAATDRKQIEQAMALKQVASDEIGILDYFACKQLCFNENPPRLDSHHLIRSLCELDEITAKLGQISLDSAKAVNSLYGQSANKEKKRYWDQLQKSVSTVEYQIKYVTIRRNQDVIEFLNLYSQEEIKSLEVLDCSNSTISTASLGQLLSKAPNVQVIYLNNCRNLWGEFEPALLETFDLSKLQKLQCSGSTISTGSLGQLLSKAPNIQELYLDNSTILSGKFEPALLKTLDLRKLQNLGYSGSTMITALLGQLLSKAPNVQVISLPYCENLSGEFEPALLESLDLSKVRQLSCDRSTISTALLWQLLSKAPNVEIISLWHSKILLGKLESALLETLDLGKVKYFTCDNAEISSGMLRQLLSKAPNVQEIRLLYCTNLSGEFEPALLETLDLSKVQKLDCSESPISTARLGQLLSKAPNIQEIRMRGCTNLSGEFVPALLETLDLGKVQKLDCYRATISAGMLGQLLSKAPNVQELELSDCPNLSGEFEPALLETLDLSKVQKLFCNSSALLEQLLSKAPNIQKIPSRNGQNSSAVGPILCTRPIIGVDADTGPSSTTEKVPLVFQGKDGEHPSVRDYRQYIHHSLRINDRLSEVALPFEWYNDTTLDLSACEETIIRAKDEKAIETAWEQASSPGHKYYYGIVDVGPSDVWLALPSLSPDETVQYLYGDVDIRYSNRDNLYFVKNYSKETKIHFILKVPEPSPEIRLDAAIQTLINECSVGWKAAPLTINTATATGAALLQAIFEQKKGACRHRVVAFYDQMQKRFPQVHVRAVSNGCHVFAELFYQGRWHRCDLGGIDADLDIDNTNHPNLAHRQLQISRHSTAKETIDDYFRKQIVLPGKNSLIQVHSTQELESCLKFIQREYAQVCYVEEPNKLSTVTACSILVVNVSTFDAEDIKRLIEPATRKGLPKDACIVGLYIINGSFVGRTKEFLAYFHNKLELLPFDATALSPSTNGKRKEAITSSLAPSVKNVAETEQKSTQSLLRRLVLQTLWSVPTSQVKKFQLNFNQKNEPTNFAEFVERHLLIQGKNVHIALHSQNELDLCTYWLQKHIQGTYYIDRPEDIRCSARWVDQKGKLQPGPGGPLYDYLQNSPRPVIIINFNTFKADDIVRCNSIIDSAVREADGVLLPENGCVIGLSVIRPDSYTGKDFTGRFYQSVELLPFSATYPVQFSTDRAKSAAIDLYGASDWKEKLRGRWIIQGDNFIWKKGFLQKGHTSIEIQNGPWENRDFRHFWQQVSLQQNLIISKRSTHDWQQFQGYVHWIDQFPSDISAVVINPTCFGQTAVRYRLDDGKLSTLAGSVKMAKDGKLYAYMTRSLSNAQWYRLLLLCKKHHVALHIVAPEGIYNPLDPQSRQAVLIPAADIIVTENIDPTLQRLEQEHPNALVFDITESDSRILQTMDATWIDEVKFRFKKSHGALLEALDNREHVILKGAFSEELIDALMPLLLPPNQLSDAISHKGRLTLVTGSKKGFEIFATTQEMPIEVQSTQKIAPFPKFCLKGSLHQLDLERLNLVCQALECAPHVSIEGATGVGKTTFITEVLAKQFSVFIGMEQLADWAESSDAIAILFIDEANVQKGQFSCFEGLYNKRKGILDEKGRYYPLGKQHYVVFALNSLSYGGERHEVSFLQRHKNTIHFTPLTDAYLRDVVLRPYEISPGLANMFIEVYKQAAILTPRELEMMALMARACPERDPKVSAYYIALHALPKNSRPPFCQWFEKKFGKIAAPMANRQIQDFVLTASRQEAFSIVSDLVAVRRLRKQTGLLGGLGGLVLEGAPGDGKSHFAVAALQAHGFIQVRPHEIGTCKQDAFCKLPANMPADEKKACLLAAFHAGQWVIEDEMNASPSLESLHNALLMGFDETGKKADTPGFMLIGTQNPIPFAGRRATTLALKRRLITYEFSPYPQKEMYQIIHQRYPGLSEEVIRLLTQKQMSFRELLSLVEKGVQAPHYSVHPLPDVREQRGHTCKLYALSTVMDWLYKKSPQQGKLPPPARKRDTKATTSVRELAKKSSHSQVGEIYSPHYLEDLAKRYGFDSTRIVDTSHEDYIGTLKRCLDQGHAPIVFFDVDMTTGRPIKVASRQEHAAVAVGYFYNIESVLYFSLLHWGKPWVVSAQELAESANNLSRDREPETFYKIDGLWRQIGDRSDIHDEVRRSVDAGKYSKRALGKKSNDTFRNKLVVVA